MRQYYRVFCLIEGKEENMRTTYTPKLKALEINLGAQLEEIPQGEVAIIRAKINEENAEFLSPSKSTFFNGADQFINMNKFRTELDAVISKTAYHQQVRLFDHSKEVNKFLREQSPFN